MKKDVSRHVEKNELQLRKGLLAYAVLQVLKHGPVYSSDILSRLRRSDLIVVEGTVYPLLSRLADEKILDYEWQESQSGPPRKYYRLTPLGQEVLDELSKKMTVMINTIKALEKDKGDPR